jgi:hypothetical protein
MAGAGMGARRQWGAVRTHVGSPLPERERERARERKGCADERKRGKKDGAGGCVG